MLATTKIPPNRTIRIKLPGMHTAQKVIKRGMGRFNVIDCGRRFGKDFLGQDRAIYFMSKAQPVGWGAPTYRMLTENFDMLADTLAPIITRKLRNERLEIMGGGSVDFWSLDQPDRIRGHKYAHFIVNEAAMVPGLMDAWNLIIRPTLLDLGGSCDFMSTPRGLNDFYSLWKMALDIKGWERFHYTSYDNPFIPRAELDELKANIPERSFQQEIMAEFIEDGAFFRNLESLAVLVQPDKIENHAGHKLYLGADWAKSEDFSVFTIGCRDCARVVDWWRGNQVDYTYQRERLVRMAKHWGVVGALPERNSIGEPNIEMLRHDIRILNGPDGKPGFNTTATTKSALIDGLAAGFENGNFQVPAEARDELQSYQIELTANNRYTYSAPAGYHDDWVMSLAILWHAMSKPQGVIFG